MKKYLLFIILITGLSSLYWFHEKNSVSSQIECAITITTGYEQLIIENRGKSQIPLIKGFVSTQKDKLQLIKSLNDNCQISEFDDFIEISKDLSQQDTWINFSIDNVNNVITVSGEINRQTELQAVLDSLATTEKNVVHSIHINKNVANHDFAQDITFLLTAIDNIQMADITIYPKEMVLKGLVRDKLRQRETINKVEALFADQLTINDQLETVAKNNAEYETPDIEFAPLPSLDGQ